MLSDLSWRKKRVERTLREVVDDPDRFVDIGVELRTVAADPNGLELIEGKPKLRILRTRHFGGMLDSRAVPARLVGPSRSPQVWYCSEDQESVLLNVEGKAGQLVYGSEGAGKTVVLAMFHYFQWISHLGEDREGGATAPTGDRLDLVRAEMFRLYPSSWYTFRVADGILVFADKTRIRLVSTYQQSAALGSPIQGFSWSWATRDEGQDQVERHSDIESRGRAAKHGVYPQLITATAKDNPDWRTLRDMLQASGLWTRRTMLATSSPFVAPSFWEAKRLTMTPREYDRRILAMDVGPERMLYYTWARDLSVRPVPQIGAEDVTSQVLSQWGNGISVLVGHDPGKLWHVSVLLKAYRDKNPIGYSWFVVDEVTTRQSTVETHVGELLTKLREDWGCNRPDWKGRRAEGGNIAMVRADPYSDSSSGDAPDRGVYTTFRKQGILIHPAAYAPSANVLKVGRVSKEGRLDMVNRLLCSADGSRRLFVACDDLRRPAAPKLVDALETMERDVAGRAEMERKDDRDKSHWPAALGYALWQVERPRMEERRVG